MQEEEDYETRAFKNSIATILSNPSEFALYSISKPNVHPARLRLELMQQLSGFLVEKPLVQNNNSSNAFASSNAGIEEQQLEDDESNEDTGSEDDQNNNALEVEYEFDYTVNDGDEQHNTNNDQVLEDM